MPERVVLTMPRGGSTLTDGAAKGFFLWPTKTHEIMRMEASSSAANHTFNRLWSEALMMRECGFKYFAMIHSDVCPEMCWLDILMDELHRLNADVISSVIPIKDEHGLTSTALDKGDLWHVCRLTMKEVMALPETFDSSDVGYPLLLNNGLWLCDMTKPWAEQFSFETLNRISRTKDGKFFAQTIPEDWLCSRKFHDAGLKIYATRKVKIEHEGFKNFNNYEPWGTLERDDTWYQIHELKPTINQPAEETVCV